MARSGDRLYRVTNTTRGTVLAEQSGIADSFVRRGFGLMMKKGLPESGGLIIRPCNSVVSFFMRFPIDVVFVDRESKVRHIIPDMVPWRTSSIVRGSKFVVELPAGTVEKTTTQVGDEISLNKIG